MTLVFGAVGAGIGTYFGNPTMGWSIGTFLGGVLFPPDLGKVTRGKLDDLRVTSSGYGAALPIVYGSHLVGGNVIWATDLEPHTSTSTEGGKGGGGMTVETVTHSVNLAVAVCEGPIDGITRIWANDLLIYEHGVTDFDIAIYTGTETQDVDPTIEAVEGVGNVPAYRGTAYVVFTELYLTKWGEQIPSFRFEISGAVTVPVDTGLSSWVDSGVVLLAGEDLSVRAYGISEFQAAYVAYPEGTYLDSDYYHEEVPGDVETSEIDGTRVCTNIVPYCLAMVVKNTPGAPAGSGVTNALRPNRSTDFASASMNSGNGGRVWLLFNDKVGGFGDNVGEFTVTLNPGRMPSLQSILEDLSARVGLAPGDYDMSAGANVSVPGMLISDRTGIDGEIRKLLVAYSADLVESDGQIKLVIRPGSSAVTVPEEDLGAFTGEPSPDPVKMTKVNVYDLPRAAELSYFNLNKSYEQMAQRAVRYAKGDLNDVETLNTGLSLDNDTARRMIETVLYLIWLEANTFLTALPYKYIKYTPGDVITVPFLAENQRLRVVSAVYPPVYGLVQFVMALDDAEVYTQSFSGASGPGNEETVTTIGKTTVVAWNGNSLLDSQVPTRRGPTGYYVAACGGAPGWPGCQIWRANSSGGSFQLDQTIDPGEAATIGYTTDANNNSGFNATGIWDDVSYFDVLLVHGSIESATDSELLNGANFAYLGGEYIQFGTVVPLGGNEYRVSHLLRGRRGSPITSKSVNAEFVLLNTTTVLWVERMSAPSVVYVKAVTNGALLERTAENAVSMDRNEYKMYCPVHVTGERDGSNNLTINWVRRARYDFDLQDNVDVPQDFFDDVGEEYEVDIIDPMDPPTVLRTIVVTSPTASYSAAQQTSDGLTPGNDIPVIIYQMGSYGRGHAAEATI